MVHPRIVNWMADEQPSTAKLEGPDCFSNPKAFEVLRVQVSELQADNKVLKMELEDIKSHMSSLNEGKTNKIEDIIQMQACIRNDLMDIRTNMQFLSESVSTMISSAMDDIIRRSVENVVSKVDRKGKGKMDPSDDLLFSLELPSFDLGTEFTPPNVLHSKETQKRVDSIISNVVTATKIVENEGSPTAEPTTGLPVKWVLKPLRVLQSPFVAGQERGKLFKHDNNVVIFEDYRDNVDEVDKSAFMGLFQRGYKPKNK
ncbi:Hypothetical predicted protein [Olea europaea subsp. europaea]|uniref:Uncharacterized protein n=1 Tax=Olea europaea subsp. europaea TaxID=158383 RepID=A0A8S0SX07_OLEEU|nr:Hypothetical predicted protein [Olea europaea subsp. europaea]